MLGMGAHYKLLRFPDVATRTITCFDRVPPTAEAGIWTNPLENLHLLSSNS